MNQSAYHTSHLSHSSSKVWRMAHEVSNHQAREALNREARQPYHHLNLDYQTFCNSPIFDFIKSQ